MADIKIVLDASQFEAAVKQLQTTIKGGGVGVGEAIPEAQKLLQIKKESIKLSEVEKLKQQAFNKEVKLQAQFHASAEGSINRMKASLGLLLTQQGNLNRAIASEAALYKKNEQAIFNYRAQLKTLEAQMNNHQRNVGNYLSAIRRGFAEAGIAIAAVVGVYRTLEKVLGSSLKAAMEWESAQKKLFFASNQNIDVTERLVKSAEKYHKTTLFTKEQIAAAYSYALGLGRSEVAAEKMVVAAMGLSRVTGKDVNEAMAMLSATMEGVVRGVARYDSRIKQLTPEQLKAGMAIDLLSEKLGKFMTQGLETTEGKLVQFNKSLREMQEQLGNVIISTGFGDFLQNIANGLNVINDALSDENLNRWQQFRIAFDPAALINYSKHKNLADKILEDAAVFGAKYAKIDEKTGKISNVTFELFKKEKIKLIMEGREDEAKAFNIGYYNQIKALKAYWKQSHTTNKEETKIDEKALKEIEKQRLEAIKVRNEKILELEKELYKKIDEIRKGQIKESEDAQDDIDKRYRTRVKGQAEEVKGIAKESKKEEKQTTKEKLEIADDYYNKIDSITNGIGQLWEGQRQREIEGAKGNQRKIDAINKEYGEKEKLMAIAMSTIQYAMGMVKIWSAEILVLPKAIADSALLTTQFGINLALINSQKFAKGIIGLDGAGSETSDSILAWLSKGESVTPADKTRKYKPALEAIHKDRFEEYVYVNYVMPEMNREAKTDIDRGTAANMYEGLKLKAELDDYELRRKLSEGNYLSMKQHKELIKTLKTKQIIR